jgi:hypothetical protein
MPKPRCSLPRAGLSGSRRNLRALHLRPDGRQVDDPANRDGSDGTRTRDLRRDRPVLVHRGSPGVGGDYPREQCFSRDFLRGLPGGGGSFRRPPAGCARDARVVATANRGAGCRFKRLGSGGTRRSRLDDSIVPFGGRWRRPVDSLLTMEASPRCYVIWERRLVARFPCNLAGFSARSTLPLKDPE